MLFCILLDRSYSGESKKLGEVKVAILAIDSDATKSIGAEHILSVTRAINPACNCALNRISLTIVVCDVLREASFVERHFCVALIKAGMTDGDLSISH